MAQNSLLTNSIIVNKALMELKNELGFTGAVNRQYDDQFAKTGAKVGNVINIRKPDRYVSTSGSALTIQESVNRSVSLTLDQHEHVGMAFSEVDRTLSLDKFNELYIKPAVTALANKVDYVGQQVAYRGTYNSVGVPSASAFPSDTKGPLAAMQKIFEGGAPVGADYTGVINPATQASMVYGMKGLFQDSGEISKQYRKGVMGTAAGVEWRMSQNVQMHTIGALGGTPLTNYPSAFVDGSSTLVTDGWTNSATGVLKKGDVISIANVYAVNPQSRQSTGSLAQFVVQDTSLDADGSGNVTITLDRAIVVTGKMQNVNSAPANNAAITIFGHASSYAGIICPQNLIFHKDAYILGCADFELPDAGCKSARANDKESGLSLSIVSQFDIQNHRTIHRLDILFGWMVAYADLAARMVGQPA